MTSQLARLARPFPDKYVHGNPSGGGSYVTHSVVNEKLLAVLGPFGWELVRIVRGRVEPIGKRKERGEPALEDAVVGAVCRLSAVVDGDAVCVEEVGDCEQPHNWPHDGARLKDAMSDALKRCAMRLGVGLHLWSQGEFSLYQQLVADSPVRGEEGASAPGQPPGQPAASTVEDDSHAEGAPPATVSPNQLQHMKARVRALTTANVSVADERDRRALPKLESTLTRDDYDAWQAMLTELEQAPM